MANILAIVVVVMINFMFGFEFKQEIAFKVFDCIKSKVATVTILLIIGFVITYNHNLNFFIFILFKELPFSFLNLH
jgi:hypothetical protein